PRDGRDAEWKQIMMPQGGTSYQVVLKGTTRPVFNWTMGYTLERPDYTDENQMNNQQRGTRADLIGLLLGGAALGFVSGALLVYFLWHWKKRRYVLVTLLPIGVAAFVVGILIFNEEFRPILHWGIRICAAYALWEAIWMCIGILIGRPLARTLLRMFIP